MENSKNLLLLPRVPDRRGHFGPYGGRYVAETLMPALTELERGYAEARRDPSFRREFHHDLCEYAGRETPLYFAERLSQKLGGAKIYLKREDLCHTGAHKINNTIGQILLARRMRKRRIIAETGAEIDIKDDGLVTVAATDGESIKAALKMIQDIVAEPEVGKIYDGTVVKIMEFGAFVNIMPGRDGLVHVSQISDKRVEKVSDVLHEGEEVKVKLTAIDDQGRLNLSMKDAK